MRKKAFRYSLLILLILITALQSFMLINYHSSGEFFPRVIVYKNEPVTDVMSYQEYLSETYVTPFEIDITGGEGLNVYKVSREEQGYFTRIWKDTLDVLGKMSDVRVYELYDLDKWNEITGQAGYIVKLGYDCPIEFLNWITSGVNVNNDIKSIDKLMILPLSSDEGDVYVKSGDSVYRYVSVKLTGLLRLHEFNEIYKEIKNTGGIVYAYLNEVASYDNFKGNIQPDTAVIIADEPVQLQRIRVTGYDILTECMLNLQLEPDISDLSDKVSVYINEVKTKLFGRYMDVYKTVISESKELSFSDQYNVYTIHSDGSVSYRYGSASYVEQRGDISQAFLNALGILTDMRSLSSIVSDNMYLADITVNDDFYTFRFAYRYEDYPVFSQDKKYSIVVNATSDRVLSMDAKLYDITDIVYPESYLSYDLTTFPMLSAQELALGSIKAYDMYIAYLKDETTVLTPVWIIEDTDPVILIPEEVDN